MNCLINLNETEEYHEPEDFQMTVEEYFNFYLNSNINHKLKVKDVFDEKEYKIYFKIKDNLLDTLRSLEYYIKYYKKLSKQENECDIDYEIPYRIYNQVNNIKKYLFFNNDCSNYKKILRDIREHYRIYHVMYSLINGTNIDKIDKNFKNVRENGNCPYKEKLCDVMNYRFKEIVFSLKQNI